MSRLPKEELFDLIKQAIKESGWSFRVVGDRHPFLLYVYTGEAVERLRIYIWNVTHGGRTRPIDEYRIQITTVDSIDVTPPLKTLLLGWDRRYEVFAGYNASRYTMFGQSPSLQIKEGTLERAGNEGFAIQPKEWDEVGDVTEVVVAFRPELFMTYASNLEAYHRPSLTKGEVNLIQKAASKPLDEDELSILPVERRRVLRQHSEAVRNNKFRKAVLQVYGDKCGVCGLQLGVVEASHIVPVADGGTDEVTNGIALCPNHHKAFDLGLFLITPDYKIFLRGDRTKRIREDKKDGGLDNFIVDLRVGEQIFLPADSKFHPNPDYLGKRMRLEGFRLVF